MPWVWTNATGRWRTGPGWLPSMLIRPNCWTPAGALDSIVIVSICDWLLLIVNRSGLTVIFVSGPPSADTSKRCRSPLTFLTSRVVTMRPGMTGALIDGMLRWIGVDRVIGHREAGRAPSRRA